MKFGKLMLAATFCLASCQTSNTQGEGDLPAPTIPPSIADSTTSTVGFANIAITIFPFQNSEFEIGDCYDMGDFAEPLECDDFHDGQVISSNTPLDSSLLTSSSEDQWFEAIDESCIEHFESFVSIAYSYGEGPYVIDAIIKSANPLSVYCTIIGSDGEKWRGSAEVVIGSYDNVVFGNCFDPPTDTEDALVIPCSKPHYAEMFLVDAKIGLNDIYDPYPTDAEWDDIRDRICPGPFKKYTGKSFDDVDYSIAIIFPLESDWEEISSRTISCAITSGTGANWSGSKRK